MTDSMHTLQNLHQRFLVGVDSRMDSKKVCGGKVAEDFCIYEDDVFNP